MYRGTRVRRACDAETKNAYMRIFKANTTACESMTLGNQTNEALKTLQTSSQLSTIIKACVTLGKCEQTETTYVHDELCAQTLQHDGQDIALNELSMKMLYTSFCD